ncbi:Gfo/Idh/MocA family protein [Hoeflea sp.]|uniref:Gfo/Idh/MocA family protein n=1 Tax=Hoeflea sp. TaxID=1940281 RepID=UPI0037492354
MTAWLVFFTGFSSSLSYNQRMTKTDTIRWGIAGTGHIAQQFAGDMHLAQGARLTAVASRSAETAQTFADRFEGVAGFASLDAMIGSGLIDAVYIASPNTAHHAQTLACINARMPVLVEKPLTANLAQALEIQSAARAAESFVMEAMWSRYLPAMKAARGAIRDGAIGRIRRFEADLAWKVPYDPNNRFYGKAQGGSVLHDLGVYPLSLARYFLGEPDHVDGTWQAAPTGVDISARLDLRFADTEARISCSFERQGMNQIILEGDKGVMVLGPLFIKADHFTVFASRGLAGFVHPGGDGLKSRLCRKLFRHLPLPGVARHFHRFEGTGMQFEIEAASNAVRDGRLEEPCNTLDDTIAALRMVDQVLSNPPEAA